MEDVKASEMTNTPAVSSAAQEFSQSVESDDTAYFREDESSTEDVKIPSEEKEAKLETVEEEGSETEKPLKPKSVNRFQTLANERNQYKSLWEKEREEVTKLRQHMQTNTGAPVDEQVKQEIAKLRLDNYEIQETMKWEKAFVKHPELETDREIQDIVYAQYIARKDYEPELTPADVASQVLNVLEKKAKEVRTKAYTEAEQTINKQIASQVRPNSQKMGTTEKTWDDVLIRAAQGDKDAEIELFR